MIDQILEFISTVLSFNVDIIERVGYWGVFGFMFLESSFVPFPSEVVMCPAGYLAQQGKMSMPVVISMGIFGSLAGALFNYYLAVWLGIPFCLKYGRYFGVTEEKFNKAERAFRKHGEVTTFVGRLIPLLRQYISFPAGLSRMSLLRFSLFTSLGAGIWVTVLTYIGYAVGENQDMIKEYTRKSLLWTALGIAIIVVSYIYYQKRRKQDAAEDDQ